MKIEKISDTQLKITDEVVKFANRADLEEDRVMLKTRLAEINVLLNTFMEIK